MRRGEARRGGTRRGEEQKQEQEQKQDRRGAARTRTDCARIQVSVLRHAGTVKGQRGISRSLRYFVHLSPSQRAPLCSLIGPFPWPNYRRIVHHRCCSTDLAPLPRASSLRISGILFAVRLQPIASSPFRTLFFSFLSIDIIQRATLPPSCPLSRTPYPYLPFLHTILHLIIDRPIFPR